MKQASTAKVVAQIGCGYWGPNLLRNFNSIPECQVKYLIEKDENRRRFVNNNFNNIETSSNWELALNNDTVDALIIATPAHTHFDLAKKALQSGKDVFVEKPIATTVDQVEELMRLAEHHNKIVMTGHTFVYNDAVCYVKKLINEGKLGDIRYINCQRLNLGRIRSDVDALWNFAPHDISIIQFWLDNLEPEKVVRTGMDFYQQGIEDVTFLNLRYPGKVMANVHVSWLDPIKTRKIVVVGTKKMVVYDDVSEDKIYIYDKGIDVEANLGEKMDFDCPSIVPFHYRSGDLLVPKFNFREPLKVETEHFIDCIRNRKNPHTCLEHARSVVQILQEAEKAKF
jgi:predicted dehydrogenase